MMLTALYALTHPRQTLIAAVALSLTALECAERPAPERPVDIANGDDALAALVVGAASTRYQTAYWLAQARTNPPQWRQAESYCGGHYAGPDGQRPNCAAVVFARETLDWQGRARARRR